MKKIFLRTFGCQMNVRDSEIVRGMLEDDGYIFSESPDEADIIIFNTCSVREHAEHRAISILASIARKKPKRIIGLIGCVAQHRKKSLFRTIPNLDFICGPSDIYRIPEILILGKSKLLSVDKKSRPITYINPFYRELKTHAYVNIMYGCNNFCSYCIVPYVRGKEVSRPQEDIIKEIRELVDRGIRDVTLLGQNVNSYRPKLAGHKEQTMGFIDLLEKINDIDRINKIGFITSHPKDASIDLFKAISDLKKVKKELHLPLQSGSNRILELMNRGYEIEKYKELTGIYRDLIPEGRLTTDIIIGFPTEKEEDFDKTKKILEEIRFDSAFIFKYSPRSPAKSALMRDDVTLDIKKRRHSILLNLQRKISQEKLREVLV